MKISRREALIGSGVVVGIAASVPSRAEGVDDSGAADAGIPDVTSEPTAPDSMMLWDERLDNFVIGPSIRPPENQTGSINLGIGRNTLTDVTTASSNLAVGHSAMELQIVGNGNVAIGNAAMQFGTAIYDSTYVGTNAGRRATVGTGDTGIGFRALEQATSARNNTALGDSALWINQGEGNVAAGYRVAEFVKEGNDCIFLGRATGVNRTNGDHLILIGGLAGAFPSVVPNPDTGEGSVTAGDRLVAIGYRSLQDTTGSDHVAIGHRSGAALSGGDACIFIGANAGDHASQKNDAVNSIVIGAGAYAVADNQVVLGNSRSNIYVFGSVEFSTDELSVLKNLASSSVSGN